MTEERALLLFARCYNSGDFTTLIRRLHKRATYESHDHFYRYTGREKVAAILEKKAAALNRLDERNRAYRGYVQVRHDVIGTRMECCLVLTGSDPRKVNGVVRMKCTPLHIKDIIIENPSRLEFTRADYVEG